MCGLNESSLVGKPQTVWNSRLGLCSLATTFPLMNVVQKNPIHAIIKRYVWLLTLPFAGILYQIHTFVRRPELAPSYESNDFTTTLVLFGIAALVAGFGLAMVTVMAVARRAHWRFHLRFRAKRLFLAIVLTAITPVGILTILPIFGSLVLIAFPVNWVYGRTLDPESQSMMLGAIVTAVVWYVVSGLIISTINSSKIRRGFVFCIWWVSYSAMMILLNNIPFRI